MNKENSLSLFLFVFLCLFVLPEFSLADSANLVTNPGAEAGDSATGWTITANGGNGWNMSINWDTMYHSGSRVFRTSYGWDVMEQTVDLNNATGVDLSAKPDIVFSDWINSRCDGVYYITYKILDSGSNVIATYNFGTSSSPASISGGSDTVGWEEKTYTFSGYSTVARYAYIQQAGKDSCGWAGYYGPHFDDASIIVKSDAAAPTVSALTPADNSTGIGVTANLIINFSENVDVESGNIYIKKTSDNSTVATIDVTSAQVTGTGTSTITINPSSDLGYGTNYYVQIDASAFDDTSGNSYAGISDTTSWNFETEAPAISGFPAFASGTPAKFGAQLTVAAGTLNPATNLTYTWYRSSDNQFGGDAQLGIGTTYTPVAADIGKYLIVSASSTDATGTANVATEDKVINAGSSVSTNTSNGNATLSAPDGFASDNVTLDIEKISSNSVTAPAGYFLVGDNHFQLTATDSNGDPVSTFDQAITFTVSYGSSTETQYVESTLDVYKYENGGWTEKNCTLDTNANTLTCSLSSFSEYGVFGEEVSDDDEDDIEIKNVKYSSDKNSIAIKWKTDTKADSKIKYGIKKNSLKNKKSDRDKEKKHEIVLANLDPDTLYYFKIYSKDGDDNSDSSKTYSVMTKSDSGGPSAAVSESGNGQPARSNYSGDAEPNACSYIVQDGDNLWAIAKKIYGDATAYPLIIEGNKEKYSGLVSGKLSIGQELFFDNCENNSIQGVSDIKEDSIIDAQVESQLQSKSRWWNPFAWF